MCVCVCERERERERERGREGGEERWGESTTITSPSHHCTCAHTLYRHTSTHMFTPHHSGLKFYESMKLKNFPTNKPDSLQSRDQKNHQKKRRKKRFAITPIYLYCRSECEQCFFSSFDTKEWHKSIPHCVPWSWIFPKNF